ncbi:Maf family protein [Patescibacteria group bacterium]|nr:Maf family protein [Patescibacteria group bacterium]MBU1500531.1 Maf family protein [Patescibacteria group bacterium]MBU2080420.1 Maf family protein [Patescibacteria group bacterium]MBU2123775.1 Maf family protein [Patescibacteria group bacterium]MBU2194631.1 Maf family protein [Patescibacteria group bacterium]
MSEGLTFTPEKPLSEHEKLVRSWKKGPVILASGSSFKLESLRALGMPQAVGVSVPEIVEEDLFEKVGDRSMHMHEMVAAMVAREKVRHVLKDGAPEDALVCAFDTVVMETTGSLQNKKRRYLQKPETREQATADLTTYFTNLVEGKEWKDVVTKGLVEEARRLGREDSLESLLSVGYPQSLIHITTGMAVRVPNAGDDVDMIFSVMRLTPTVLQDLVPLSAEKRRARIEEIVEKALSIMDDNERWRSITTGIDYSDPRIKELLGLTEAKIFSDMDESEEGIMKGMPKEAFEKYLSALAEEQVEPSSDAV